MAYVEAGRVVHDADAHILETPEWLEAFATPAVREPMARRLGGALEMEVASARDLHADPAYRARDAAELMTRKNWRRPAPSSPRIARWRSTCSASPVSWSSPR